ncbi:MAG: hypothetical protein KAR14_14550, partial [Candidatus Aminicenantes bacterium]|nr:hypothetical protein [Candidatus Aminicenantes bacterium]
MSESEKKNKDGDISSGNKEFANMMEEFDAGMTEISEGEKIEATILSREDDMFYLDLGGRYEGEILCEEFLDPESLLTGDKVDVYIQQKKGGFYKCSASKNSISGTDPGEKNQELESVFQNSDRVNGRIT